MATKPSIPKGTRDFSPAEMAKRNYIFDTIRKVYHLHGFRQIDPGTGNAVHLDGQVRRGRRQTAVQDTELGRLLQRAYRRGTARPERAKAGKQALRKRPALRPHRALRTLRGDAPRGTYLPFKRYQIQPVWRADRPQKGRYREFYQCDADIVGSDSLLNEVEFVQIIDTVFANFGIRVCTKINNRKILAGIAEVINAADKIVDITVAIDKLDKIGLDNVNAELREKGISDEAIARLQPVILLKGDNEEKLASLRHILADSPVGMKGVEETEFILSTLKGLELKNELQLDLTLARGLNYYTGAIFEVKALDVQIGSITGGGRYDNLTGVFGMSGVSGVGISFGADRIFDVLNQLELYPKGGADATQVLFTNFGEREARFALQVLAQVRAAGICAELYPDCAKMKKQMSYANANHIPFVVLVGENELNEGKLTLKDMATGEQRLLLPDELVDTLRG